MRKTVAAVAAAAFLSPVNAQVSGPVTNFSNDAVILAQATNTARDRQMAKKDFNKLTPKQVSDNLPNYTNTQLSAQLDRIQPRLASDLNTAVYETPASDGKTLNLRRRQSQSTGQYIVTGDLQNGNTFVHLYQDLPGTPAHITYNFQRKQVNTEEEFNKLQGTGEAKKGLFETLGSALGGGPKETISPHTGWTGPGKYMLNGFIGQRQDNGQYTFAPLDPYQYLQHLDIERRADGSVVRGSNKEMIIKNLDSPQVQQDLGHFDPRDIGLSLDPKVATGQELKPVAVHMSPYAGGPATQQPGQQQRPGQPQRNGPGVVDVR